MKNFYTLSITLALGLVSLNAVAKKYTAVVELQSPLQIELNVNEGDEYISVNNTRLPLTIKSEDRFFYHAQIGHLDDSPIYGMIQIHTDPDLVAFYRKNSESVAKDYPNTPHFRCGPEHNAFVVYATNSGAAANCTTLR